MLSKLLSEISSSFSSLKHSNPKTLKLLLAVSGGSDSIALLYLMNELKQNLKFSICVVTINHNIRDEAESRGDAEFVKNICSTELNIECSIVDVPKGKIESIAGLRNKGIEEAARFVRYKIFEKAKKFFEADYILTAHTKDDFYEGVLMSIFNGASPSSLLGMKMIRGYYFKPLLGIGKEELKKYLNEKGLKWREDSTNSSLNYLRNKIRLSLVPVLKQTFAGWQNGLAKTISRLSLDEKYINTAYNNFIRTIDYWSRNKEGGIQCNNNEFLSMPDSFKIRFLQEGFILLKVNHRVTYFSILNLIKPYKEGDSVSYNGISLHIENGNRLLLKEENTTKEKSKSGYMVWVEGEMSILIGSVKLAVEKRNEKYFVCSEKDCVGMGPFPIPFCIRSRLKGDVIKINGKEKNVKSILTNWKLSLHEKDLLPIIEVGGVVKALYGGLFGLKNLIFC
ncbi:MAG: tRNA lysidine(34) synthetase TilS [Treponema sp.]